MEKTFQFVDGANIDKTARRSIRSHVMKGRNAGRTVNRPSRLSLTRRPPPDGEAAQCAARASREEAEARIVTIKVARNLGSLFRTLTLPFELSTHSIKVVNQFFNYVIEKMYPPRFGLSPEETKAQWLGVLLSDEGACHCSIALMEACNGFLFGGGVSSPESLHHLSQTFALVRKRLESDEALSDATLGIILMLVIQEQIRREDAEAVVHFEGLRKMVELRGGMCQLERNPPLLLKICKVDITYALQSGQPILFFRDRMSDVQATLESKGFALDRRSAAGRTQYDQLHPYLRNIVVDVMDITALFSDPPGNANITAVTFQEFLVSICSRLIHFHPLNSSQQLSAVDAAYHIGLTVFMMSLFLQHDYRRVMDYDLVTVRLKEVLDRGTEFGDDLGLWLVCLGGVWLADDLDRAWLDSKARELAMRRWIGDWPTVRNIVCEFPWIDVVHDDLGRMAWERALQVH